MNPEFDRLLIRAADATAKTQRAVDLILDAIAKLPGYEQHAVIDALNGLLDEQSRLADLYATERVSKERAVTRALKRPDCEIHRSELVALRTATQVADNELKRAEAGRLALLVGMDRIDAAIDRRDLDRALGKSPTETLTTMIRRLVTQAHLAHREAWA